MDRGHWDFLTKFNNITWYGQDAVSCLNRVPFDRQTNRPDVKPCECGYCISVYPARRMVDGQLMATKRIGISVSTWRSRWRVKAGSERISLNSPGME